jgi:hypothetical protein
MPCGDSGTSAPAVLVHARAPCSTARDWPWSASCVQAWPGDGHEPSAAVRIGPRSAWCTVAQALLAGHAGDLADQVLQAADGLGTSRMLVIDDLPAGIGHEYGKTLHELVHRTLANSMQHVEIHLQKKGINTGTGFARGSGRQSLGWGIDNPKAHSYEAMGL